MTNAHWDDVYKNGRDFKVLNLVFLDELLKRIASGGTAIKSALDIGCGKGDVVIKLAKKGIRSTGIDVSDVAIAVAKEAAAASGVSDKASFVAGDAESGGIPNEKYDAVFSKLTIAFIGDKKKPLDIVKEHLAPAGVFVLITPVLFDGYDYSDRLKAISVPYGELKTMLGDVFGLVEEFNREYFDENGCEITFIARA